MHKTVRMQEITPAIAARWLEEYKYEAQRGIRHDQVKYLAEEMRQKRFIGNTIAICVMPGGTHYMVNGYHTLSAIIACGISQTMPVEFFDVRTKEDIAKVYARFDRQLKRTRVDTWRVYGLDKDFDMSPSWVNRFAAASVIIMRDFASGGGLSYVSDDEVAMFMIDYLDACQRYKTAISETPMTAQMQLRHVMPVALLTLQYDKSADEFWHNVASDDGLNIGDPAKTLHNWIKETGLSQDSNRKRTVSLGTGMRGVAAGWNAHKEGRTLNIIRVTNTTLPIVVRGTPYDPRWKKS